MELGMRALEIAVGSSALELSNDDCFKDGDDNNKNNDVGVLQTGGNLVIKLLENEDTKGFFPLSLLIYCTCSWFGLFLKTIIFMVS